MDVIRRPYTTTCQFNTSGPPSTIRWYIVPRTVPTLGIPSEISSLDWLDNPWSVGDLGERPGAPRPYDRRPAPVVAGLDHVCGTREDFERGGVYDPSLPRVEYAPDGLPACCRRLPDALLLGGGAQLLGEVSILLGGANAPRPPMPFGCETYTVDPPLTGPATLTRITPGDPAWWNDTVGGVVMDAFASGGGMATWLLLHSALTAFYAPDSDWDGTGCRTFYLTSGSGPSEIEVCCAD